MVLALYFSNRIVDQCKEVFDMLLIYPRLARCSQQVTQSLLIEHPIIHADRGWDKLLFLRFPIPKHKPGIQAEEVLGSCPQVEPSRSELCLFGRRPLLGGEVCALMEFKGIHVIMLIEDTDEVVL